MLPEAVTICGMKYTVEEVDDRLWDNWGKVEHHIQRISIDKTATQEQKEIVLLHEVIHTIMTQSLAIIKHDEQLITCLSNGIWATGYRINI